MPDGYDASFYKGRRVLITAGLGSIGSNLAVRLVARDQARIEAIPVHRCTCPAIDDEAPTDSDRRSFEQVGAALVNYGEVSGEPIRIQVLDAARDVPEENATTQRELAEPAYPRAPGRGVPEYRHR